MTVERAKATPHKQIDNNRVIVMEWRFEPGAETGWHKHGYDYVIVPGMDGEVLIEMDGEEKVFEMKEGQSYFRPAGVEHNVISTNDFEFYFVEVELL